MPRFLAELPGRLFLVAMFAGAVLIAENSLEYFDFRAAAPFVVERLPERFPALWLASLRVHVGAALLSLPLCLLLMVRSLQRRPVWHRWIGRVTGVIVLFALVPSGVVLAFHAKGGALVTVGFLLSAAVVAGAMAYGVAAARRLDLRSHRRAMRHVVGQMSVAVTSRALLAGFDAAGVDPGFAYVVALWGPVLATIAVVEIFSLPRGGLSTWVIRLGKGVPHDRSALRSLVRIRSRVPPVARFGR